MARRDEAVALVEHHAWRRVQRVGKWWDEGDAAESDGELEGERQLMLALASGAVVGRTVLGKRAGESDVRVGRGTRAEAFVKGPLCADVDGFSLHAGVRVEGRDRRRLEHLWAHQEVVWVADTPAG